jgi:hypothetical protein
MELTNPVICLKCGGGIAIRINRSGFLQRKVLSHFGYYPWKCGACGRVFLVRRRGERPRSARRRSDSSNPGRNQSPQT